MNSSQSDILESPLPIYLIKVNTSAFDPKRCNLLQRTKERYLPHYWNQMHLDQKRISPSSQDRLSQLTTGQIDRLIDLEKIHTSLNSKKQKLKQEFFTFKPKNVNSHANTYQACFLSKINQIAIKKNIRHESADIGIYVGGDSNRSKKKVAKVPFKYRKSYEIDSPNHGKSRNHYAQVDDQKSIASIEDDLDGFQKKIQEERDQGNELRVTKISIESLESRRSRRKSFCPAGVKKKWFYGLSKVLTQPQEKKAEATPKQQSLGRSVKIDIESQMTPPPIPYSNNSLKNHFHERSHSTGIETYDCPYVPLKKYKLPRLITVN